MVENKHKTEDKIKYFNDVRQLYLQAMKKYNSELLDKKDVANELLNPLAKNTVKDVLNLYHFGNCLKNQKDFIMHKI